MVYESIKRNFIYTEIKLKIFYHFLHQAVEGAVMPRPQNERTNYMQDTSIPNALEQVRKRGVSPLSRRTRRKRRSNRDLSKETPTSSSSRIFPPIMLDQSEHNKRSGTTEALSSSTAPTLSVNKPRHSSTGQSICSSPDGHTPKKTQLRRRIRSQSKLSDLVTSSSNESLFSNK